ncbi:uncharacterized protein TNIN_465411 [Trichonephila inaurata madagascariensis]|uniref:Uncharacterized protein n=1 Tax=Trichonephila inaurata madagascariensis TaxID=2747483 RepID=A0A8X7CUP2_9ARAC|nr:uncharacterized protein TNIN_465411 [Trichonephila inaurata madagascariensis]
MHPSFLRHWGILFIIAGFAIIVISIYVSYIFSLIGLTEAVPGIFTIYLGAHLIKLSEELRGDMPESLSSKDGRISPFYYELEPSLVSQRALPPIPKDIGRIYDPVTMDKV